MLDPTIGPGETVVRAASFRPSLVIFWMRTEIVVTSARVVVRAADSLLGVVPLGYRDSSSVVAEVAPARVEVRFSAGRGVVALVFLVLGLVRIADPVGWTALLVAVALFLHALDATLVLQGGKGAIGDVHVALVEKGSLEQVRDDINNVLFAQQAQAALGAPAVDAVAVSFTTPSVARPTLGA